MTGGTFLFDRTADIFEISERRSFAGRRTLQFANVGAKRHVFDRRISIVQIFFVVRFDRNAMQTFAVNVVMTSAGEDQ